MTDAAELRLALQSASWRELQGEGLHSLCAYQILQHLPDLRSPDLMQQFSEDFGRAGHAIELLTEIDIALQGLTAVVFKGASFLGEVYPALGTRPLSDIDLWVRADQENAIGQRLVACGYVRMPGPFAVFTRKGWSIDLHTHPLNQFARVFPLKAGWWESAAPLGNWHNLRTLDAAHSLVVTALHGLKHSFRRLIWLLDVGLLWQRADLRTVSALAEEIGATRMLGYVAALTTTFFRPDAPTSAGPWTRWEQQFLKGIVDRRAPEAAGMLVPLFARATPWTKLRYLVDVAYPEKADWRRTARLRQILRDVF